ncbi:hypothetical protein [Streptomyces sp. CHB9.2]|uniref:hypothetical protein n=1 Tax=Streptomyces sp. CHB9.2 TaxID=2841670 RepID=UPI002095423D|nr:hypothetical protein [Streptomyces sp. CHB9.2]MCO6704887.1 hypothetical protein [Streptomyces sp. CHB9.2]
MSYKYQMTNRDLRNLLARYPDDHLVYFEAVPAGAFMHANTQPVASVKEVEVTNGEGFRTMGVLIQSPNPKPVTEI